MDNTEKWTKVSEATGEAWNWENGAVQGVYLEKRENIGENESNMYMLKDAKRAIIGVWGTTVVDAKMQAVEVGNEVRITPLGEKKSEKSGRTYKDYDVEYRETPFKNVDDKEEPPVVSQEEEVAIEDISF